MKERIYHLLSYHIWIMETYAHSFDKLMWYENCHVSSFKIHVHQALVDEYINTIIKVW